MTGCKYCDANCFDNISDGCVGYTGEAIPGVPDGASVRQAIVALKKRIEDLETLIECGSSGASSSSTTLPKTSLVGFGDNRSSCSDKITNTNVRYTVLPGKTSVAVTYSLEDIINGLPQGYKANKKQVRFYGQSGSNTLYNSSDKTTATFSFSPDKFPLTMSVLLIVGTPCGTVPIEKTVLINADLNGTFSGKGLISDYGKEKFAEVTQEEYNQTIKDRVLTTNREVESILHPTITGTENIYIPQNADLISILQKLVLEIDELKANK